MSTMTITVPKEYGYVLATATSTFFISTWLGFRTVDFRKKTPVKYPRAYADTGDEAAAKTPEEKKALYLFNCAQRAHANFLENQTSTVLALLIAGVDKPLTAAALGATWSITRIIYAVGYTRADKEGGKGRYLGFVTSFLTHHALIGLAAWASFKFIQAA